MKTRLMILFAMATLIPCLSYAQEKDSVSLIKLVDEMDDKSYIVPSNKLVIANKDNTEGVIIDVFIKEDFSLNALYVKSVGIGTCCENDEIIILFENGEKLKKTSVSKFNCEGKAYFFLSKSEIDMLRNLPIKKFRITNGRSYESFTKDVPSEKSRWFIQLFYAMDNKLFTEHKE